MRVPRSFALAGVKWRAGFVVLTFKDGELLWPEIVQARRDGRIDFRGELFSVDGY